MQYIWCEVIQLIAGFAHRNDMLLFETSAKDGTDVELAVMMVAESMKKNCHVA